MSQLTSFVIAGIQCDPQIARPDLNLKMIADLAAAARDSGAKLAIFPECAVSGYCFDSLEEALEVAEPVPGPSTAALVAIASRLNLQLIVDPYGKTLAAADDSEQMLMAEINPALSRDKHIVRVPGAHEIHRLNDRQPDQYGPLVRGRT